MSPSRKKRHAELSVTLTRSTQPLTLSRISGIVGSILQQCNRVIAIKLMFPSRLCPGVSLLLVLLTGYCRFVYRQRMPWGWNTAQTCSSGCVRGGREGRSSTGTFWDAAHGSSVDPQRNSRTGKEMQQQRASESSCLCRKLWVLSFAWENKQGWRHGRQNWHFGWCFEYQSNTWLLHERTIQRRSTETSQRMYPNLQMLRVPTQQWRMYMFSYVPNTVSLHRKNRCSVIPKPCAVQLVGEECTCSQHCIAYAAKLAVVMPIARWFHLADNGTTKLSNLSTMLDYRSRRSRQWGRNKRKNSRRSLSAYRKEKKRQATSLFQSKSRYSSTQKSLIREGPSQCMSTSGSSM